MRQFKQDPNLQLTKLLDREYTSKNKDKLVRSVENKLGSCNELDEPTVKQLLACGLVNQVLANLPVFTPDAHRNIAYYLINHDFYNNGFLEQLFSHMGLMKELNHRELALYCATRYRPHRAIENLEKFTQLGIDDYYDIISVLSCSEYPDAIDSNIEKFIGTDHNKILNILIDRNMAVLAVQTHHKYHNINYGDLLKKMIDTGNGRRLIRNINYHDLPEGCHIVNTGGTQFDYNIAGIYYVHDKLGEQLAVLVGNETFSGKPDEVMAQIKMEYAIQSGQAPLADYLGKSNVPDDLSGLETHASFNKPKKIDWAKYPNALEDFYSIELGNPNLIISEAFRLE